MSDYGRRWQTSREADAKIGPEQEVPVHVQERFELYGRVDPNNRDDGQDDDHWSGFDDARITRPIGGGVLGIKSIPIDGKHDPVDPRSASYQSNVISGGMDPQVTQQNEMVIHQDGMPLQFGKDYSDRSARDLASGFSYLPMDPCDDFRTDNELYSTVEGTDDAGNKVKGKIDRKNWLDRL